MNGECNRRGEFRSQEISQAARSPFPFPFISFPFGHLKLGGGGDDDDDDSHSCSFIAWEGPRTRSNWAFTRAARNRPARAKLGSYIYTSDDFQEASADGITVCHRDRDTGRESRRRIYRWWFDLGPEYVNGDVSEGVRGFRSFPGNVFVGGTQNIPQKRATCKPRKISRKK